MHLLKEASDVFVVFAKKDLCGEDTFTLRDFVASTLGFPGKCAVNAFMCLSQSRGAPGGTHRGSKLSRKGRWQAFENYGVCSLRNSAR